MLSLSVRQIEYAIAVMEFGSVSGAAEALNISQPALSVAISRIEEHFGKPLFIRRKGASVVPTSFGRSFLQDANLLLGDFNQLLDQENKSNTRQKPITIGCFVDLAPMMLAPAIIRLNKNFPDINILTVVGDFEELTAQLKNGEIDFAISYNLGLDADFDQTVVTNLKPKVFVGEGHRFAKRGNISLNELAEENLVLADQALSVSHIMNLFHSQQITPNITNRVATLELMRSYVANDLGVGISYTVPDTDFSYDGKVVKILDLNDYSHAEPIVIATYKYNTVSDILFEIISNLKEL